VAVGLCDGEEACKWELALRRCRWVAGDRSGMNELEMGSGRLGLGLTEEESSCWQGYQSKITKVTIDSLQIFT
jgi:hypothetical protein